MAVKSIYQQQQERKAKGKVIAVRGDVLELRDGTGWTVLGDAEGDEPRRVYLLTFRYTTEASPAMFDCTCTDYARNGHLMTCKHGEAVEIYRTRQAATIRATFAVAPVQAVA